jgi:hypothetical protein
MKEDEMGGTCRTYGIDETRKEETTRKTWAYKRG